MIRGCSCCRDIIGWPRLCYKKVKPGAPESNTLHIEEIEYMGWGVLKGPRVDIDLLPYSWWLKTKLKIPGSKKAQHWAKTQDGKLWKLTSNEFVQAWHLWMKHNEEQEV